jgi:hypothetical protein
MYYYPLARKMTAARCFEARPLHGWPGHLCRPNTGSTAVGQIPSGLFVSPLAVPLLSLSQHMQTTQNTSTSAASKVPGRKETRAPRYLLTLRCMENDNAPHVTIHRGSGPTACGEHSLCLGSSPCLQVPTFMESVVMITIISYSIIIVLYVCCTAARDWEAASQICVWQTSAQSRYPSSARRYAGS